MKSTFCYICGSLWLASESFEIIKVQTPYLNAKLSELKSALSLSCLKIHLLGNGSESKPCPD